MEKEKRTVRRDYGGYFFGLGVFVFFFIYFSVIHPIVIADSDDWDLVCFFREAVPMWNVWNPTRVFAECFMPWVSKIAAYVLYPITGDLFQAFTTVYAAVVAGTVACLTECVYTLFYRRNGKKFLSMMFAGYFIISHFLIFRCKSVNNINMLTTVDACTYFYYVLPNLLNCILVLIMVRCRERGETVLFSEKPVYSGAMIILMYFCVFSNIWASIITVSYVVVSTGKSVIDEWNARKAIAVKQHAFEITVIVLWVIAQIFEMSGGRADSFDNTSYLSELKEVFVQVAGVLKKLNRWYIYSAAAALGMGTIAFLKRKDSLAEVGTFFGAALIFGGYCIVTCAKVKAGYIARPDVFYGAFFFLQMILLFCLDEAMKHFKRVQCVLPLCLVLLTLHIDTIGKTFVESNVLNAPPALLNRINRDIVEQIREADQNRMSSMQLVVPKFQSKDNWPYAQYVGYRAADMAYEYRIVDHYIEVTEVVVSETKNEELAMAK